MRGNMQHMQIYGKNAVYLTRTDIRHTV
uniref:Uncharacterized protein n=1 Tax=Anguilla anguilla TaxID=7936 RepID=A0A0E9TIG9_ANGAN